MRNFIFPFFFLMSLVGFTQELNCLVTINSDQIQGSNRQVFETLEKSISEFINQKKWTTREVKPEERINCAMNIIFKSRENSSFKGSIQIQSTRPIFNSSYESPVLNLKDDDFNFQYNEYDQLIYNPTRYDSELVSILAFYVYVIIGVDADTFSSLGGTVFLKEAENTMLQAQQGGVSSWSNQVGKPNRFMLIDNLLSSNLRQYRSVMYNYHRVGFDNFSSDQLKAKQTIENTVITLERIYRKTISNYLLRIFFDAKSDEIVQVFSDGPDTRSKQKLLTVLQKISNNNNSKWRKMD